MHHWSKLCSRFYPEMLDMVEEMAYVQFQRHYSCNHGLGRPRCVVGMVNYHAQVAWFKSVREGMRYAYDFGELLVAGLCYLPT